MDAKQAADMIKSGHFKASDFQRLYAALVGKKEYISEFNQLRQAMLKSYAKGESIEVSQGNAKGKTNDEIIVDQKNKTDENGERLDRNIEKWKKDRRQDILQWAAETKSRKVENVVATDDGLHADFKDGTKLHFIAQDHVAVSIPQTPKAQNFDVIVALAQKNKKKIKLGENMSSEFRLALIEACAKANVQISNLSLEDLDTYMRFMPQPQQENAQKLDAVSQSDVRSSQSPRTKDDENAQPTAETTKDKALNNIISSLRTNAERREAQATQQTADAGDSAREYETKTINGHSLKDLTAEELEKIQDQGLEYDIYSTVSNAEWEKIQNILHPAKEEDNPYTIRTVNGHSLGSLTPEQLEVLHENDMSVDRYSRVNDEDWNKIKDILGLDKTDKQPQSTLEDNNPTPQAPIAPQGEVVDDEQTLPTEVADEPKIDSQEQDSRPEVVKVVNTDDQTTDQPTDKPVVIKDKPVQNQPQNNEPTADQPSDNQPVDEGKKKSAPQENTPRVVIVPVNVPTDQNTGDNRQPTADKTVVDDDSHNKVEDEPHNEQPHNEQPREDEPPHGQPRDKDIVVPVHNTPATDVVKTDDDKPSSDVSTDEPEKKESALKKWWKQSKLKKLWDKGRKWIIGAAIVGAALLGARSCNGGTTNNDDSNKDKNKVENVVNTPNQDVDDTPSILDFQDDVVVPHQWNASMGITKKQFDNMYNITHKYSPDGALWERMWSNANENAAKFSTDPNNPMTPEQFMFKAMRIAAWTNHMRANGWAKNYSGIVGDIIGPTMAVLKCGDQIEADVLAKAKIMLSAVGRDGSINVYTLDKVAPGTSKYNNHDAEGWIIGTTNNRLVGINDDCGQNSEVEFRGGAKVQKVVEEEKVVEQPREVKKIEPMSPINPDLKVAPVKAPDSLNISLPVQEPQETIADVNFGSASTAQLNDQGRPVASGSNYVTSVIEQGSDTNLTKKQRKEVGKQLKELLKEGKITQDEYNAYVKQVNSAKYQKGQDTVNPRINQGNTGR